MHLLLIGGRQKRNLIRIDDDEHRFDAAMIVSLDTDSLCSQILVEYKCPLSACADSEASSLFTSGTLRGDKLFVCTYTEVLIYQLPTFTPITRISLPCFNSLHHVCPTNDDNLLLANTGLDMVVEIATDGTVVREWSVTAEKPWTRFSPGIDYRRVASTKPHRSHPNFVFQLGKDIWVTRFWQRDALCLTDDYRRIDIAIERVHDGVLSNERLYFTTVDGHLLIFDALSLRQIAVIDLKAASGAAMRPGWCRGVMVVDEHRVWVGFTRIRKPALVDKVMWLKHGFREAESPTHIALYDVAAGRCLQEIPLEDMGINILFGVLPGFKAEKR